MLCFLAKFIRNQNLKAPRFRKRLYPIHRKTQLSEKGVQHQLPGCIKERVRGIYPNPSGQKYDPMHLSIEIIETPVAFQIL